MSKALATQMRDFAVNPSSQALIVGDASMMQTLVQFTDASNPADTIIPALEAFNALTKNSAYRSQISALPGLLPKLATLCDYDDEPAYNAQIISLAKQTLENIQSVVNVPVVEKTKLPAVVVAGKAPAFGARGYLQPVTVFVSDITNETIRQRVESVLISTKGTVSVTVDMQTKVATVYTQQKVSEFQSRCIDALVAAGYKASASLSSASGSHDKENSSNSAAGGGPSYLTKSVPEKKDALVRFVDQNEKKKQEKASGGWLAG